MQLQLEKYKNLKLQLDGLLRPGRQYELHPGDIVFTGTPAGVGALSPGDVVEGSIDKLGTIQIHIGPTTQDEVKIAPAQMTKSA